MADRFFSYDPLGDGLQLHATADEARNSAQRALDWCRDNADSDGWPEDVEDILWGRVVGHIVEERFDHVLGCDEEECADGCMIRPGFDYCTDYTLAEEVDPEIARLTADLDETSATLTSTIADTVEDREALHAARVEVERLTVERDRFLREASRLADWLLRIDGGDVPCDDAATLRRWAYQALTLGREAPCE